ncbi:MAG: hypothetical protein D6781_10890 [Verrucomicrobia bacterium]|nr:MAG: hypothetical protein D6781_10890 [Verrucomicrobiota bacterium]
MKVGLLSESPADEAALRILLEALLGESVSVVQPPLRARGWPNVSQVLGPILWHLQFRTDAEALVVCVDADDSTVHEGDHGDPDAFHPKCRLCLLEMVIRKTRKRWKLPEGRRPLHTAVALAVPAVEGWYLAGRDPEVGEATWRADQAAGHHRYTRRDLKIRVYGTRRPTLEFETRRAQEEARRLAKDIALLETLFPVGFGYFARCVREWRREER